MNITHVSEPVSIWQKQMDFILPDKRVVCFDELNGYSFTFKDENSLDFQLFSYFFADSYHGYMVKHLFDSFCPCCKKEIKINSNCNFFDPFRTHQLFPELLEHSTIRLKNLLEYDIKIAEVSLWDYLTQSSEKSNA